MYIQHKAEKAVFILIFLCHIHIQIADSAYHGVSSHPFWERKDRKKWDLPLEHVEHSEAPLYGDDSILGRVVERAVA